MMTDEQLFEIGHILLNSEKAGNPLPPRSVTADLYREVKRLRKGIGELAAWCEQEASLERRACHDLQNREEFALNAISLANEHRRMVEKLTALASGISLPHPQEGGTDA